MERDKGLTKGRKSDGRGERWTFGEGEIAHTLETSYNQHKLATQNSNTTCKEEIKQILKNLQSSLVS